jgi:large subunit ribosomal protein L7/L12
MSSENPKLEKLLEQRGKIENRIKQIQTKETAQKRKIDTRRKILFGVMFEGLIAEERIREETINRAIEQHLTTDRDRELVKNYLTNLRKPDPKPQEENL